MPCEVGSLIEAQANTSGKPARERSELLRFFKMIVTNFLESGRSHNFWVLWLSDWWWKHVAGLCTALDVALQQACKLCFGVVVAALRSAMDRLPRDRAHDAPELVVDASLVDGGRIHGRNRRLAARVNSRSAWASWISSSAFFAMRM